MARTYSARMGGVLCSSDGLKAPEVLMLPGPWAYNTILSKPTYLQNRYVHSQWIEQDIWYEQQWSECDNTSDNLVADR